MANKTSEFANNVAVISNITALTMASLRKVSDAENVSLNAASRDALVKRIVGRIGNNLRNKQVHKGNV